MKIIIEECKPNEEDTIIVRCAQLDDKMLALINSLKAGASKLAATKDGQITFLEPKEVFYFEAVDNKVFLYTQKEVYETRLKLYEIEEQYCRYGFIRISKSIVVSLMKIKRLSPAFNGRFEALLKNNEKVIVSRQYVPSLKEKLGV